MILDLSAVSRKNTESFYLPFTYFTPMVRPCETVVQYHNLDDDTDTVKIQGISTTSDTVFFYSLFVLMPILSLPLYHGPTNLLFISVMLSFQECHINGIT